MRFSTVFGSAAAALALTACNAEFAHAKALSGAPASMPDLGPTLIHEYKDWDLLPAARPMAKTSLASLASWYGPGFDGNRTASGERYNQWGYTAAHRSLPFGTRVRVTNLRNGRSVVVRVNDDGPHIPGRVIDLSRGAAERIGMVSSGVAPVRLEVLR